MMFLRSETMGRKPAKHSKIGLETFLRLDSGLQVSMPIELSNFLVYPIIMLTTEQNRTDGSMSTIFHGLTSQELDRMLIAI